MKNIAAELVRVAKELSASDYSELDPRKVTTLAESIAVGVLGWPKVADVLANGYEFVLARLARDKGLDKVRGLTKWDIHKIGSSTYASSSVSVVKGNGKRQRELDKAVREILSAARELIGGKVSGRRKRYLVISNNKLVAGHNDKRSAIEDVEGRGDWPHFTVFEGKTIWENF